MQLALSTAHGRSVGHAHNNGHIGVVWLSHAAAKNTHFALSSQQKSKFQLKWPIPGKNTHCGQGLEIHAVIILKFSLSLTQEHKTKRNSWLLAAVVVLLIYLWIFFGHAHLELILQGKLFRIWFSLSPFSGGPGFHDPGLVDLVFQDLGSFGIMFRA